LAVATQADGSFKGGGKGTIRFGFFKDRKKIRLEMLLDDLGILYTRSFR
jgi:hypothetical protein